MPEVPLIMDKESWPGVPENYIHRAYSLLGEAFAARALGHRQEMDTALTDLIALLTAVRDMYRAAQLRESLAQPAQTQ